MKQRSKKEILAACIFLAFALCVCALLFFVLRQPEKGDGDTTTALSEAATPSDATPTEPATAAFSVPSVGPSETAAPSAPVGSVPSAPDESAVPTEALAGLKAETGQSADRIAERYGAVGVQAAVIRGGNVRYAYSYGTAVQAENIPVAADTKYRVASLSKFVTEVVVMRLVDEGRVFLDGDISDYLGYRVRNPYYPDDPITPRMLMEHSSSVIDSDAFLEGRLNGSSIPLSELVSSGASYAGYRPRAQYSYSNFGVSLVGAACEKVTGRSFESLAEEYIFRPLGIDAGYVASSLSRPDLLAELYGSGGMTRDAQLQEKFLDTPGETYHLVQGNLTISAADYAKILCRVYRDASAANGGVLLSAQSAQEMFRRQFGSEGFGQWHTESAVPGVSLCCHTGSNFGMFSTFVFNETTGDGVVVLTSGADTGKDAGSGIYNVCLDYIRLLYGID